MPPNAGDVGVKCNRTNLYPVAFYPPDLIACFIPQPPPRNRQTIDGVTH